MEENKKITFVFKGNSDWSYYEVIDSQGNVIDRIDVGELRQSKQKYIEMGYEV